MKFCGRAIFCYNVKILSENDILRRNKSSVNHNHSAVVGHASAHLIRQDAGFGPAEGKALELSQTKCFATKYRGRSPLRKAAPV